MDQNSYNALMAQLQSAKAQNDPNSPAYKAIDDAIRKTATDYAESLQSSQKANANQNPPNPTNSPEVTVGSATTSSNGFYGMDAEGAVTVSDVKEYNVLHNYNSYNYVWTLAAMTQSQQDDPDWQFSDPELSNIIVRTSGKGSNPTYTPSDNPQYQELLTEFNDKGIGRFDFFIDHIDVATLIDNTESDIPVGVNMTVVEPLTMNGFLESIRLNCLAAGFPDHKSAPLALKLEFWGWKADSSGKMMYEKVPNSSRIFPSNIAKVDIDTGDRGVIYKIRLTNSSAWGLGFDGRTNTTIKASGHTVFEILDSFRRELNYAVKQAQGNPNPERFTEYDIVFDPWTNPDGTPDYKGGPGYPWDTIKINDLHTSNQSFIFPSHGENVEKNAYNPDTVSEIKYDPTNETAQFPSGESILKIISAVIRDSKYVEDWIIKRLEEYKKSNKGMVPWYRIYPQVRIKDPVNKESGNPTYKITYVVKPYWVHYSRLPIEGAGSWDPKDIVRDLRRKYNYLYTGKNIDILDFKMNLNYLYFQQLPFALGAKDQSALTGSASPNNSVTLKINPLDTKDPIRNPDGGTKQGVNPALAHAQNSVITGKAAQATPYQQLALAIHETLLSNVATQNLQVKIIGDPYYLVTSGIGFGVSDVSIIKPGETNNGEADYLSGDVYVNINFQVPRDIRPDGFMDFGGTNILPYGGLFKVTRIRSEFNEGVFTQNLTLIRMAGQVLNQDPITVLPLQQTAKAGEQLIKDQSTVAKAGPAKPSSSSLKNLLSVSPGWGLPDLFGLYTKGISAVQGTITGALSEASNALNTTVAKVDASLATALSPVTSGLQFAGQVATLGVQLGGIVAVADALISGTGTPTVGQSTTGYSPLSNGIRLNTAGTANPNPTQANISAQASIISSFIEDPNMIRTLNTNYTNNVFSNGTTYSASASSPSDLNNVGQQVAISTNGTPADPTAIANTLGINPAELTGLNAGQQSDILGKLLLVLSLLPTETNLQQLQNLGMSLDNLYGNTIANLPSWPNATATAPDAKTSEYDIQKIVAGGGNVNNLPGAAGIASVAAIIAMLGLKTDNGIGSSVSNQAAVDKLVTSVELQNSQLLGNSPLQPAQAGLGSVESNAANVVATVNGYGGYYQVTSSVNSVYGTQRTLSPLDVLMITKKVNG
jgi:hypothetical protein